MTIDGRPALDPSSVDQGLWAASCCSAPCVDDTAGGSEVLAELQNEEIPEDVAALRAAGFKLLLDTGEPVGLDTLSTSSGVAQPRIVEIIESAGTRGRVEFDDQGRLIGIAGLSLTPTRHVITVGTTTRWTWCALDAVGILGALKATGYVRSTDPHTGQGIEIGFSDGEPTGDAHLFIMGGFPDGDVRQDWCPQVNFFATRDAAEDWVADRELEGDIVAVATVADQAAALWGPVVDIEAPQTC